MKKILLFLLSINLLFSSDIATTLIRENGINIMVRYPKAIIKGKKIRIVASMQNNRKYAHMGGLTLSFPQFNYAYSKYNENTFDSVNSYSPPDKIYSSVYKRNISAKYFMVEGWERKWYKGEKKLFFIELDVPTNISNLTINIRGVLVFGKSKKKRYEVNIPSYSQNKDQQGYSVKQINIAVLGNQIQISPIPQPETQTNRKAISQPKKAKKVLLKQKSGTGFFITNSYLLTNYHVIKGCSDINIRRNGYNSIATVVSKDENNDLSLLKADDKNSYSLKFRNSRVKIGEDIITLGYPLGDLLGTNVKLTTGVISAMNGLNNDSTKYQFSAPTQKGNSGGPLIDRYGSVIGVIYAGLTNVQNVNLAIKVNTVKQFLESNDIDYQNSPNSEKKDISDIADDSKKAVVQVICR